MENEIMNDNEIMEAEVKVVDQEPDYYPATTETDTDTDSKSGGLLKLAAIGVGGFILGKKFVWDRRIKPALDKRRAAKKAEVEAEEEARFESWAIKRGLLVPTATVEEPNNGEVQDIDPEETTEETK